jgi:hypothetical protein
VSHDAKIIRPIWAHSQKGSVIHKARKCGNGNQLVRMGVKFNNTYDACMDQHCLGLFVVLSALLANIIEDGNVVNVYAHADAEGPQIYIVIYDVYQSRHNARYSSQVDLGDCVPLLKATHGHPQVGIWREARF